VFSGAFNVLVKPIISKAIVAAAITTASLAIPPARANDSTAELTTGGLVFIRNAAIVMRAEELFISTTEIRVRYGFFNKSDKDITNTVAFPMPDITFDEPETPFISVAIPTDDPENILDFSTTAAGRSVNARVEQKVFANGIDQTALLRRFGIPLAPHLGLTQAALDDLPREEWTNLINLGLVKIEKYSPSNPANPGGAPTVGPGEPNWGPNPMTGLYPDTVTKEHLVPRWRLKTTYFWQQTFPARRETVIEHRYKPSVGSTVRIDNSLAVKVLKGEYYRKYCVESDFIRDVAGDNRHYFSQERIDYVLKTGSNWSGPIREFRLVVDKGAPDNLVSFCATGVSKISPTQFEVRKTNFVPKSDLSILILKPERGQDKRSQAPAPIQIERTKDNHSVVSIAVPLSADEGNLQANFDFGETRGFGGRFVNADATIIAVNHQPATKSSYVHIWLRFENGDLMFINNVNGRVARLLKGQSAEWAQYFLLVEAISGRKVLLRAIEGTSPNLAREYNFAIRIDERGQIFLASRVSLKLPESR
jgi:hypothetical protein